MSEKQKLSMNLHNFICLGVLGLNFLVMTNVWIQSIIQPYIAYINTLYLFISFFVLNRFMKRNELFGWLLLVGSIFVISLFNGSSMGAVCSFLDVLISIVYFQKIKIGTSFLKVWLWINFVALMWTFVQAPFIYQKFLDAKHVINPNTVGFCVYICFCTCIILRKKLYGITKGRTFLLWLLCLVAEWLIKSRTCLVVVFLFGVGLLFFEKFLYRRKKMFSMLYFIILIMGCIFPFIYTKIGSNDALQAFIYRYTGKTFFSGREWIWGNLFREMGKSVWDFLFGPGSNLEYQIGLGFSMHNLYMEILLDFGIVGIIFFVIFVMIHVITILKKEINFIQLDLLLVYAGLLIMSYAEVVIFTPYSCLMCGMFLGLTANLYMSEKENAGEGVAT